MRAATFKRFQTDGDAAVIGLVQHFGMPTELIALVFVMATSTIPGARIVLRQVSLGMRTLIDTHAPSFQADDASKPSPIPISCASSLALRLLFAETFHGRAARWQLPIYRSLFDDADAIEVNATTSYVLTRAINALLRGIARWQASNVHVDTAMLVRWAKTFALVLDVPPDVELPMASLVDVVAACGGSYESAIINKLGEFIVIRVKMHFKCAYFNLKLHRILTVNKFTRAQLRRYLDMHAAGWEEPPVPPQTVVDWFMSWTAA